MALGVGALESLLLMTLMQCSAGCPSKLSEGFMAVLVAEVARQGLCLPPNSAISLPSVVVVAGVIFPLFDHSSADKESFVAAMRAFHQPKVTENSFVCRLPFSFTMAVSFPPFFFSCGRSQSLKATLSKQMKVVSVFYTAAVSLDSYRTFPVGIQGHLM